MLANDKYSFVRLDGSVEGSRRQRLLREFAEDSRTRVALVGVTACAVSVSLSAASTCIFCELPPDMSWLLQAESRLHRRGQRHCVQSFVCVGLHCAFDAKHWARLLRSFDAVTAVVDGSGREGPCAEECVLNSALQGAALRRAKLAVALSAFAPCTPPSPAFFLSPNTDRVHIFTASGKYCGVSFSAEAMHNPASDSGSPSQKLMNEIVEFYSAVQGATAHERRLFASRPISLGALQSALASRRMTKVGIPSDATARFERYERRWLTSARGPVGTAWMAWRVWFAGPICRVVDYPARVSLASPHVVYCANCDKVLPLGADVGALVAPGAVVELKSEHCIFCSGKCRAKFHVVRNGKAVRKQLYRAEGGLCTRCHVNCDELVQRLLGIPADGARAEAAVELLPQLQQYPSLLKALVECPSPRNCLACGSCAPCQPRRRLRIPRQPPNPLRCLPL